MNWLLSDEDEVEWYVDLSELAIKGGGGWSLHLACLFQQVVERGGIISRRIFLRLSILDPKTLRIAVRELAPFNPNWKSAFICCVAGPKGSGRSGVGM